MSSIIDNVLTLSFSYKQGLVNASTLALDKLQNYLNITDADYDYKELFARAHMQLDKLLPEPPRDAVYYKLVAIDSAIRQHVTAAYNSYATTHMKIANNAFTDAFTTGAFAFTDAFTNNMKYKNILIASIIILTLLFFLQYTKTVYLEEASEEAEVVAEEAAAGAEEKDKEFYEIVKLLEKRERLVDTNMKLIRKLNKNIQDRLEMLDYQCKILARKSKNFAKKVRKNRAAKMKLAREMPLRETAGPFPRGFYNEQELQRNVWNEMTQNKRARI